MCSTYIYIYIERRFTYYYRSYRWCTRSRRTLKALNYLIPEGTKNTVNYHIPDIVCNERCEITGRKAFGEIGIDF